MGQRILKVLFIMQLIEFDKLFGVYYCLISYGIVDKL